MLGRGVALWLDIDACSAPGFHIETGAGAGAEVACGRVHHAGLAGTGIGVVEVLGGFRKGTWPFNRVIEVDVATGLAVVT